MKLLSLLKKRRLLWPLAAGAALFVIVGIGMASANKFGKSAEAALPQPMAAIELLPSDVTMVKRSELRRILPISGALRAINQAVIKAKVSAEVRKVFVREGEAVKAGQVLVLMDGSEYEARLVQARGALQAAQGQLDIATQTRNNNKALLEKNFISKNAFDNAQSQYSIASSNVKSAKGALDVAQKALDDTIIRAPISGFVSTRTIQPGEKVSADNRLLEIVDLRQLEMEAAVPAADVVNVTAGQEVQVKVEGFQNALIGKVVRINPSIQAGSRSILVYIQIDNEDGALRMGMFAEAKLTLVKKSDVLTAPQSAVQAENGIYVVYAIEGDKLVKRTVVPGLHGENGQDNAVEIISGLEPNARIVKTNLGNLQSGTPVRIAEAKAASDSAAEPGAANAGK
jgi:RND family efflux transporter MFP subunit